MKSYEEGHSTWKRHLRSAGVTFLSGVLVILLANWDSITLESFMDGGALGVLFLAVRGGVKALAEFMLATMAKK